jgi:hypothetical protein
LDRKRAPLRGDELRGCWQSIPGDNRPSESTPWASRIIDPASGGRRSRVDFVPIGEVGGPPARAGHGAGAGRGGGTPAGEADAAVFRFRLWDDLET